MISSTVACLFPNPSLLIAIALGYRCDFNLNGDFIESQAFAFLAIRSYLKKNITFPSTTGVKKPCSGGLLFKN